MFSNNNKCLAKVQIMACQDMNASYDGFCIKERDS